MADTVLKMYQALNAEQLQFANSKVVDSTMKMKKWFDYMVPLARMDEINDEKRRRKRMGIGWTIAGMVVSLFITFAFPLFVIVLVGLTVLLIVLLSKMKTLKRIDLGNHLRLFLMPFLVIIKEECKEEAKGRIKFDASNPINPKKIVNTLKSTNSGLPQVTTTVYSHPWLDAEFNLMDGTGLQLLFTDTILKKSIKKRGSSGKIKYKSKTKVKHNLELRISFKKEMYDLVGSNPSYEYANMPECHAFKLKHKLQSVSIDQSIPVQHVLSMIAGAYQNVKPIS
jgi:hypothetical protein